MFLSLCVCVCLTFTAFADTEHVVSKGETLYAISKKYQITVAELRAANNMDEQNILKIGQHLIIPSADISSAVALSGAPGEPQVIGKKTKKYTVLRGDTFYGIAHKSNMTLSELFSMNGLGKNAVLKAGQTLLVPATPDSSRSADSSEKDTSPSPAASSAFTPSTLTDLKNADPRNYHSADKADSLLVWPIKSPTVTYVNGKVSGVQLSAGKNEAVTSIRAGTAMYCGTYRGFGHVVFIQSKTGLIYAYTGLGSVTIRKGDYITFGATIGTAGVDTISRKSQLTLMVFRNGMPIDPAKAPRG